MADPLTNFDTHGLAGPAGEQWSEPVVLSAVASQASNYPASAVQTAFDAAAQGTLAAGPSSVTYGAYAELLTMQLFDGYGGVQSVVQTWEITGVGGLDRRPRPATVEVVAVVETPKVPANNYGAFATATTCGALYFHGNVEDQELRFDQSVRRTRTPTLDNEGGDIGTNGNMHIQGSVDVHGNLYSPNTGVGDCTEGNVTAESTTGGGWSVTARTATSGTTRRTRA